MKDILLYQVDEGSVSAETVVTLGSASILQDRDVQIAVHDFGVYLNDNQKVIITDIGTSNGIIQVIDGVLLPPSEQA